MAPPFIYINGYPAVGKYTVAKRLVQMLPNAKLLDNHLLIDPVAAVYERSMPEYQGLRKLVRKSILDSISTSLSLRDVTWVFTDSQSSDKVGQAAVADYIHAAQTRGSPIVSIILGCRAEENVLRLGAAGRLKTKLSDAEILLKIRETEDIYHFGGKAELEIDTTKMSAYHAAQAIFDFVQKVSPAGR
ncbi:MAG: hypothetical protein Q9182_005414 [Xanthomendoza sp. 2 TL-2023]